MFEETLYKQALEEAALGRLSPPLSADANMDLSDIIIAQRFGVAQGLKADGTPKAACAFTQVIARPQYAYARRYGPLTTIPGVA